MLSMRATVVSVDSRAKACIGFYQFLGSLRVPTLVTVTSTRHEQQRQTVELPCRPAAVPQYLLTSVLSEKILVTSEGHTTSDTR